MLPLFRIVTGHQGANSPSGQRSTARTKGIFPMIMRSREYTHPKGSRPESPTSTVEAISLSSDEVNSIDGCGISPALYSYNMSIITLEDNSPIARVNISPSPEQENDPSSLPLQNFLKFGNRGRKKSKRDGAHLLPKEQQNSQSPPKLLKKMLMVPHLQEEQDKADHSTVSEIWKDKTDIGSQWNDIRRNSSDPLQGEVRTRIALTQSSSNWSAPLLGAELRHKIASDEITEIPCCNVAECEASSIGSDSCKSLSKETTEFRCGNQEHKDNAVCFGAKASNVDTGCTSSKNESASLNSDSERSSATPAFSLAENDDDKTCRSCDDSTCHAEEGKKLCSEDSCRSKEAGELEFLGESEVPSHNVEGDSPTSRNYSGFSFEVALDRDEICGDLAPMIPTNPGGPRRFRKTLRPRFLRPLRPRSWISLEKRFGKCRAERYKEFHDKSEDSEIDKKVENDSSRSGEMSEGSEDDVLSKSSLEDDDCTYVEDSESSETPSPRQHQKPLIVWDGDKPQILWSSEGSVVGIVQTSKKSRRKKDPRRHLLHIFHGELSTLPEDRALTEKPSTCDGEDSSLDRLYQDEDNSNEGSTSRDEDESIQSNDEDDLAIRMRWEFSLDLLTRDLDGRENDMAEI